MKKNSLTLFILICLCLPYGLTAQEVNSDYIAGYIKAKLDHEFNLKDSSVNVGKDTILITLPPGKKDLAGQIKSSLSVLPDNIQIHFETKSLQTAKESSSTNPELKESKFLPDQPLFDALMADPRWPHFSMSYQRYLDEGDLENVGHTSFGESFVFYRKNNTIRWEFGMQAGVFAIFDLDADSYDLINADYRVSVPVSFRWRFLSSTFRVLHQSSHLGDEYILRSRAKDRENLSYEKVDGLISIDLPFGTRFYGGGGYLFHKDPSDLKPWSAQAGFECVAQNGFFEGLVHPFVAIDVQSEEENNWDLDLSTKTGLQLGNQSTGSGNRLQLTLEYYQGHSPNGQFYNKSIEYIGFGLHYYR